MAGANGFGMTDIRAVGANSGAIYQLDVNAPICLCQLQLLKHLRNGHLGGVPRSWQIRFASDPQEKCTWLSWPCRMRRMRREAGLLIMGGKPACFPPIFGARSSGIHLDNLAVPACGIVGNYAIGENNLNQRIFGLGTCNCPCERHGVADVLG